MTIQLLREWNGNRVGIYTWDSGEESRLIGLGLARAWVPGIDGEARLTDSEVTKYTAAQLSAMAAAGTLTPYETYIASDTGVRSFARTVDTLIEDSVGSHVTTRSLVGRKLVNATGASAGYMIAPPGRRLYGGFIVTSGAVLITVRHGRSATGDIIQQDTGAAYMDRRVAPREVQDGIFVTLANNATVTFFFSDSDAVLPGAAGPTELASDLVVSGGVQALPLTASGRFWLGRGLYSGFDLTAMTGLGRINVFDGWTNGGTLVDTFNPGATTDLGFRGTAGDLKAPIELRMGGFIELLGSGQNVTVGMGAQQ